MRFRVWVLGTVIAVAALHTPCHAELQNIEVGGQITILGEYYRNVLPPGDGMRWADAWQMGRPTGHVGGIFSGFGWDDDGHGDGFVSQWTRIHFNADFTNEVRAYIELDSIDIWGEDFRSDYLTGTDSRSGLNNIEIYQSYIEADQMFGLPIRARIGRQELRLGGEWLVGANDDGPAPAWGLSFDGLRLTYSHDLIDVDVFWAKLAERSPAEEDGDADFYGIYGSYHGIENITLDAYWLLLRDAAGQHCTERDKFGEWFEDKLGLDQHDPHKVHTVGLRAAGEVGAFDFEAEVAYQFGNASVHSSMFMPMVYVGDGDIDVWACNLGLGYTFDAKWQPRVYLGYAYFQGEDERDVSFAEWLATYLNPFYQPKPSLSFNRLFSNYSYSAILDGTDMSNAHIVHAGVEFTPRENIEVAVDLGYYLADEAFERPLLPVLGFVSRENDKELGFELDANITYHYSEDLYFCVGWDHLFVGEGLREGSFTVSNGLDFNGGSDDEDADYWYFETGLEF